MRFARLPGWLLIAFAGCLQAGSQPREKAAGAPNYDTRVLDSRVGWYEFGPGDVRCVTWSASGGLAIVDYARLRLARLVLRSADEFEVLSEHRDRVPFVEGRFVLDEAGTATAVEWLTDDGAWRSAPRREDDGYRQHEVRYASGELEMAATLIVPPGPGPHPAVAFIHGSGDSDRDNVWMLYHAWVLAESGVAVLAPDKRGCGKSTGDWTVAAMADFAADALASVDFLQTCGEIDAARVGLVGFSQGGWIAPLAASRDPEVALVVNVAGAAVKIREQLEHETRNTLRQQGYPAAAQAFAVRMAMARRPTWWEKNGEFDPIPYWESLDVPVLAVYGTEDEKDNVPVAESVRRLEGVKSGGGDITIEVFENTGHGLIDADTGGIRADYLDFLVAWIQKSWPQD